MPIVGDDIKSQVGATITHRAGGAEQRTLRFDADELTSTSFEALARTLAAKERRRVGPRVRNVPIHIIAAGPREDQVPLNQVSKHIRKLENKLTKQEVSAVHQRLSTLRSDQLPIPKGVDPMRARPDHKALRGR